MHAIMHHAASAVVGIFQKTLMMTKIHTNTYPQCDEYADRQPVMKRRLETVCQRALKQ